MVENGLTPQVLEYELNVINGAASLIYSECHQQEIFHSVVCMCCCVIPVALFCEGCVILIPRYDIDDHDTNIGYSVICAAIILSLSCWCYWLISDEDNACQSCPCPNKHDNLPEIEDYIHSRFDRFEHDFFTVKIEKRTLIHNGKSIVVRNIVIECHAMPTRQIIIH